jgi:hypothetical protein
MATTFDKTAKDKSQINNSVKDYGNQPYFINKANQSKAFLDKHGFPKELLKKKGIGI